ncbi:hypothetical protein C806_02064 [Lachnospiraceae bacterium 3-1]|nr:hypothetical protein C806_02064 [Lachnospiraceae bacterium 3-1]
MNVMEEFVIILGISLDIFAVMECQGSLVAKVEKRQLMVCCSILVAGQVIALGIGNFISVLLCEGVTEVNEMFLGQVAAAVIFLSQGGRLFLKAWRNERIVEHREEKFDMGEFIKLYARTSNFTFLTGFAFGFLETSMWMVVLLLTVMTVLVTVLGVYTGYRLGFEHKIKAYLAGGFLLVAGGIDVIVGHICNFIS